MQYVLLYKVLTIVIVISLLIKKLNSISNWKTFTLYQSFHFNQEIVIKNIKKHFRFSYLHIHTICFVWLLHSIDFCLMCMYVLLRSLTPPQMFMIWNPSKQKILFSSSIFIFWIIYLDIHGLNEWISYSSKFPKGCLI